MNTNKNSWNSVKRILAFITAIGLWIVSLVFSYQGFSISNNDVAWAGAVMAFSVTVLELIFNTNTIGNLIDRQVEFGEWMLVIGGALAYLYDVWTNILGFYVMQNKPAPTGIDVAFIVPFLFGCLVAILPEPMFVWAMGWSKSNPTFKEKPKSDYNKPFYPSANQKQKHNNFFHMDDEILRRIKRNLGDDED